MCVFNKRTYNTKEHVQRVTLHPVWSSFIFLRSAARVLSKFSNKDEEWRGYFVDRNYIWTDRSSACLLSVSDLSSRYCIASIPLLSTSCELKNLHSRIHPFLNRYFIRLHSDSSLTELTVIVLLFVVDV